jgi:hypothetical protein
MDTKETLIIGKALHGLRKTKERIQGTTVK